MTRTQALHDVLADVELFSRHMVGTPLRPYQLEPARAIIDSVLNDRGLTFTVMMSRQAGKNELSAQLEAYLLTLFQRRGGAIVKGAPTFRPQIVNSMLRLQKILENPITGGRWAPSQGYMVAVGRARAYFFSAGDNANVVGGTASVLLEIDEAQDVDEYKYLKDFRPMASSTNATTVLYGTAWTGDTLLEHVRQENARLEAQTGIKRNFVYPWTTVAAYVPAYREFVESEIARMGAEHPIVRTQYGLEPISAGGRFLSETQMLQLRGEHARQRGPERGELYVAGIDVAGEDEEAEDAALRALEPRRDSTAVTIARVRWTEELRVQEPRVEIVEHYWWTGRKHRELFPQLVDVLKNVWGCQAVTVDATGVGAGIASFLVGALGADVVQPFTFSTVSKSDLGYQLLAAVNSGRLKTYGEDGSPESAEFWKQARLARSAFHVNQRLSWYVDPRDGHDDLLVLAGLAVEAAQRSVPRRAMGRVGTGR